jgi:hypothetical protein
MGSMTRLVQAVLAVVVAGVLAGAAAAAGPAAKHTNAGTFGAKASLLTLKDLGSGWQAGQTGTPGLNLSCKGWAPSGAGIVETGAAGTPAFAGGQLGPFLSQTTSVYESTQEAATYWKRAVQAGLITCVTQTVQAIARSGVKVKIVKQGNLAVPKTAAQLVAGYRVVANLTSKKAGTHPLYFDVVLLGKGKTLTEISLSSFTSPIPAKVESALATLVSHRLGGTPTA